MDNNEQDNEQHWITMDNNLRCYMHLWCRFLLLRVSSSKCWHRAKTHFLQVFCGIFLQFTTGDSDLTKSHRITLDNWISTITHVYHNICIKFYIVLPKGWNNQKYSKYSVKPLCPELFSFASPSKTLMAPITWEEVLGSLLIWLSPSWMIFIASL